MPAPRIRGGPRAENRLSPQPGDARPGKTAPARARRATLVRRLLAATLVAVAFAALLARDTGFAEIAQRLRALSAATLAAAAFWLAAAGFLRALRMRMLLPRAIGVGQAYAFHQVYNVVTALVPTGIGEAASAWLLRRSLRVPLHHGLVALLVGRLLDLFVLLALFLVVVLAGGATLATGADVLLPGAAAVSAALVALGVAHVATGGRLAALLERWATEVHAQGRARTQLRRALGVGAESLRLLPHGGRLVPLVGLTAVMQLVSLGALHALANGAAVPLTYAQALVCFVVYVLLRMLPLQGIGGIGTTAAWWTLALRALGVAHDESVTVGAVLYVAFTVLLVVLCLTALPFLLRDGAAAREQPDGRPGQDDGV